MPGKRYNLRITKGPWRRMRARLAPEHAPIPGEIRVQLQDGTVTHVPQEHLERLPNKTPRRRRPTKRGSKNRRAARRGGKPNAR